MWTPNRVAHKQKIPNQKTSLLWLSLAFLLKRMKLYVNKNKNQCNSSAIAFNFSQSLFLLGKMLRGHPKMKLCMFWGLSEKLRNRGKNVVMLCLLCPLSSYPATPPWNPSSRMALFPSGPARRRGQAAFERPRPPDLWGSASLMRFHICASASAVMSAGRGERDWLATCRCGEDGGSGRGHDVISLSSSRTPAMRPKVVRLAGESPRRPWCEGDCADLLKGGK